jgi:hypothetical protein
MGLQKKKTNEALAARLKLGGNVIYTVNKVALGIVQGQ